MEKIDSALISAYQALALKHSDGSDIGTAYPNMHFDPLDALWIAVVNVPVTDDAVTLGDMGADEITGYFQIAISAPIESGTSEIARLRGLIREGMKIGFGVTYQGQTVTYIHRRFPPIMPNGAYAVGVIQIYWRARTNRSN